MPIRNDMRKGPAATPFLQALRQRLSAPRRLARSGILSGVILAAMFGGADQSSANDQRFRSIFFRAGYGYCDARKLSKVFRVSPWQAKAIGGRKIANGYGRLLRQQLFRGMAIFRRNGLRCGNASLESEPSRFMYDDASRVAEIWSASDRGARS